MVKKFLLTNPPPWVHSITLHLVLSPGGPCLVELAVHLKGILFALGVYGNNLPILLYLADCNDVEFS